MSKPSVRIFNRALAIAAVSCLLLALYDPGQGLSVLLGAGIVLTNLWFTMRTVSIMIGKVEKPRFLALRAMSKYLLLGGAIVAVFLFLKVELLGFAIGISTVPVAVVLEGFHRDGDEDNTD